MSALSGVDRTFEPSTAPSSSDQRENPNVDALVQRVAEMGTMIESLQRDAELKNERIAVLEKDRITHALQERVKALAERVEALETLGANNARTIAMEGVARKTEVSMLAGLIAGLAKHVIKLLKSVETLEAKDGASPEAPPAALPGSAAPAKGEPTGTPPPSPMTDELARLLRRA